MERAWDLYDVDMKKWKEESVKLELKERYSNREFKFLSNRFDSFSKIILIHGIYNGTLIVFITRDYLLYQKLI